PRRWWMASARSATRRWRASRRSSRRWSGSGAPREAFLARDLRIIDAHPGPRPGWVVLQDPAFMPDLKLTLACWNYDRSRPLMDGRVKPDGIDLDIQVMRPRQAFPRMLEKREFHVSEMSLASYVSLVGKGECPFV